jgi:hypothetical protein
MLLRTVNRAQWVVAGQTRAGDLFYREKQEFLFRIVTTTIIV